MAQVNTRFLNPGHSEYDYSRWSGLSLLDERCSLRDWGYMLIDALFICRAEAKHPSCGASCILHDISCFYEPRGGVWGLPGWCLSVFACLFGVRNTKRLNYHIYNITAKRVHILNWSGCRFLSNGCISRFILFYLISSSLRLWQDGQTNLTSSVGVSRGTARACKWWHTAFCGKC